MSICKSLINTSAFNGLYVSNPPVIHSSPNISVVNLNETSRLVKENKTLTPLIINCSQTRKDFVITLK